MQSTSDQPFASIIAIDGARLLARLLTEQQAAALPAMQIGTMVKVQTPYSYCFGFINRMTLERQPDGQESPAFEIDLVGEVIAVAEGFERGVSHYPRLMAPVFLATQQELALIYERPQTAALPMGQLCQDDSITCYVGLDDLLGTHFAVLGATGSGKSCTVTLLLQQMIAQRSCAHILLFDPHNEYTAAFHDKAEVIHTEFLKLPYWLMNGDEAAQLFIDPQSPTYEQERGILIETISEAKQNYAAEHEVPFSSLSADAPVPYQISYVMRQLEERMGELSPPYGLKPYMRLKNRISQLKDDPRYHFMFPGFRVSDSLIDLISQLFRLPVQGKPITVLDLSGVPAETTDIIVALISRLLFDLAVLSHHSQPLSVLVVCEEAQRYLPAQTLTGKPALAAQQLSRIALEGRKYGLSLGLVTQRPALVSETILSQCNTTIILRLTNEADQAIVHRSLPEGARGFVHALPALKSREALVVGEAVPLPMRVRLKSIDQSDQPRSTTQAFSVRWQHDDWTRESVAYVVEQWRQ